MIVLGLLGAGLAYGYEMEAFVENAGMRQWAKIGMSTIYKTLGDLVRDGDVSVESIASDAGPPRKAYRLTGAGRARLRRSIADALASPEPVYSDRMAGLFFAPLLPQQEAVAGLAAAAAALGAADDALAAAAAEKRGDFIAEAMIGYYREIYAAERRALEKVARAIAKGARPRGAGIGRG